MTDKTKEERRASLDARGSFPSSPFFKFIYLSKARICIETNFLHRQQHFLLSLFRYYFIEVVKATIVLDGESYYTNPSVGGYGKSVGVKS